MESYLKRKEKDYKEIISKKYPIHKLDVNINNNGANHASKVSYSSRYNSNSNLTSSKKQTNQTKREINKEYKSKNYSNNFKKDYDFSNISKNEEPDNVDKNNGEERKKLTLFNLSTRTYELSDATLTSDGVLRGYNDNCSFYVSGTGNLKPKASFDNKYKNKDKDKNKNKNNSLNFKRLASYYD